MRCQRQSQTFYLPRLSAVFRCVAKTKCGLRRIATKNTLEKLVIISLHANARALCFVCKKLTNKHDTQRFIFFFRQPRHSDGFTIHDDAVEKRLQIALHVLGSTIKNTDKKGDPFGSPA